MTTTNITQIHSKSGEKIDLSRDHDKIVDLYLTRGLSLHETANNLGYSFSTMHRYLCARGLNRKGHSTYKRYTCSKCSETFNPRWIEQFECSLCNPENVDGWFPKAVELYAKGMQMNLIARQLFVPHRLVSARLNASPVRACKGCGNPTKKSGRGRFTLCNVCGPNPADWFRFRSYGLTRPQFETMMSNQNNKCVLCERIMNEESKQVVNVDHDHVTGVIRGLLCSWCNWTLGSIEKRPGWLERASTYLNT